MGTQTIPALNLAESSAVALSEAADELSSARSPAAFLAALDTNYRVWTALEHISRHRGWAVPERRLATFAVTTSGRGGKAVTDAHIEALIRVNREVSLALAGGEIEALRNRARMLWRNSSRPPSLDFWLTALPPRERYCQTSLGHTSA